MSGLLRKIFGVKLKSREKSAPEESVEVKKKTPKEVREEKHEDAKRRWEYDMRQIKLALHEVGEGKDLEAVLEEMNSDPLLSKPIDHEMFQRLADQQKYSR